MLKIILILLLAFNLYPASVSIQITVPIKGGNGTYNSPYIINQTSVSWKYSVTGEKSDEIFLCDVHIAKHRSCGSPVVWKDLKADDLRAGFNYNLIAGCYYLKAESNYTDDLKTYIEIQVPPVDKFTNPFNPTSNSPASISVTGQDYNAGTGSSGNPYRMNNQYIQFRVSVTDKKVESGVMYWAIYCQPHHPKYSGIEGTRKPEETFMKFSEWNNKLFVWNTQERPAEENEYRLVVCFLDAEGLYSETTARFYFNPESGITGGPVPGGDVLPTPENVNSPGKLIFE